VRERRCRREAKEISSLFDHHNALPKDIKDCALQKRAMAQACFLIIMARGELVAISEIESQSPIFKGVKACIKVCDPYNTVATFDKIENFVPALTNFSKGKFCGHTETLPHKT